MKKLLLFGLVVTIVLRVNGQDTIIKTTTRIVYSRWKSHNLNVRIGPEVGFASGDFGQTHHLGIGASALLDAPLSPRLSLIFYAGVRSFGGEKMPGSDTRFKRSNVFPLRTGVNYKLTPVLYLSGQIGESTVQYLGITKASVSQALGLGYFNRLFDLGVRWNHEYAHEGLSSIDVHARFVITLGVKRK